jgi:hypothetical protein
MVINGNITKFDLFLDIKRVSKLHTTCLHVRVLELYNAYANLQFIARIEIVGSCLIVKFGGTKNILDVLTQYGISEFCRFVLNRGNFYRIKIGIE